MLLHTEQAIEIILIIIASTQHELRTSILFLSCRVAKSSSSCSSNRNERETNFKRVKIGIATAISATIFSVECSSSLYSYFDALIFFFGIFFLLSLLFYSFTHAVLSLSIVSDEIMHEYFFLFRFHMVFLGKFNFSNALNQSTRKRKRRAKLCCGKENKLAE